MTETKTFYALAIHSEWDDNWIVSSQLVADEARAREIYARELAPGFRPRCVLAKVEIAATISDDEGPK